VRAGGRLGQARVDVRVVNDAVMENVTGSRGTVRKQRAGRAICRDERAEERRKWHRKGQNNAARSNSTCTLHLSSAGGTSMS
jgi:hypothetical protein